MKTATVYKVVRRVRDGRRVSAFVDAPAVRCDYGPRRVTRPKLRGCYLFAFATLTAATRYVEQGVFRSPVEVFEVWEARARVTDKINGDTEFLQPRLSYRPTIDETNTKLFWGSRVRTRARSRGLDIYRPLHPSHGVATQGAVFCTQLRLTKQIA